jgi:PleD family two-component response regulator
VKLFLDESRSNGMPTVIVAIDDIFFASKVNAVAQQVGATLSYAKTTEDILAKARAEQPSLIIFDLNSMRCHPVDTIKFLKQDQLLKNIPTLGFLSHVQVDLQQRAIEAGCDQVIPRSVFAQSLASILSGAN